MERWLWGVTSMMEGWRDGGGLQMVCGLTARGQQRSAGWQRGCGTVWVAETIPCRTTSQGNVAALVWISGSCLDAKVLCRGLLQNRKWLVYFRGSWFDWNVCCPTGRSGAHMHLYTFLWCSLALCFVSVLGRMAMFRCVAAVPSCLCLTMTWLNKIHQRIKTNIKKD